MIKHKADYSLVLDYLRAHPGSTASQIRAGLAASGTHIERVQARISEIEKEWVLIRDVVDAGTAFTLGPKRTEAKGRSLVRVTLDPSLRLSDAQIAGLTAHLEQARDQWLKLAGVTAKVKAGEVGEEPSILDCFDELGW